MSLVPISISCLFFSKTALKELKNMTAFVLEELDLCQVRVVRPIYYCVLPLMGRYFATENHTRPEKVL